MLKHKAPSRREAKRRRDLHLDPETASSSNSINESAAEIRDDPNNEEMMGRAEERRRQPPNEDHDQDETSKPTDSNSDSDEDVDENEASSESTDSAVQLAYKTSDLNKDQQKKRVAKWLLNNFEVALNKGGKKANDPHVRTSRLIAMYREEFDEDDRGDKSLESELGKLVLQLFAGVSHKRFGTGAKRYAGYRYLHEKKSV